MYIYIYIYIWDGYFNLLNPYLINKVLFPLQNFSIRWSEIYVTQYKKTKKLYCLCICKFAHELMV